MNKYGIGALALAGAVALSATTASAQWRGHRGHHHWGPGAGIAAGVAAGALIGSAVAARPYYGGGYYYSEPSYGYYEAPVAGYYGGYSYDDTQARSPSRNQYWRYNCGGSYGQGRDCAEGDTGR
jgi:hypothetical protein